jgi:hypothetical protein
MMQTPWREAPTTISSLYIRFDCITDFTFVRTVYISSEVNAEQTRSRQEMVSWTREDNGPRKTETSITTTTTSTTTR